MDKKKYTVVPTPQMSCARLADYLAASDQQRRAIAQSCKYRPVARVVQHDQAKVTITKFLLSENPSLDYLKQRADELRKRMTTDEFESHTNHVNADYIDQFSKVAALLDIPTAQFIAGKRLPALIVGGVKVSFQPHIILRRVSPKTNKVRAGAIMLRYSKGKALPAPVAHYQSSFMLGYFKTVAEAEQIEPTRDLCITLDAFTGTLHPAPGKAVYLFKEMAIITLT